MKSLSCISLSRTSEDPMPRHQDLPDDSYKDSTNATVLGHNKGQKIQTLIEVLRCELARPGRASTTDADSGFGPKKGWSPLYYAVYFNREAALLHFLRAGQPADDVAGIGQPPLCIAVAAGHIQIAKTLCEAGANVNASTKHNGEAALHIALRTGRNDIMDLLLTYGPDLKARTLYTGETPLHYAAAKTGSLAAVVALVKRGADYEALNAKGCSPAEVALQSQSLHAAVAIIGAARGRRNKLAKEKEMLLKHVEKAQSRFSMNNDLIADIFEAGCDPDSTVLIEAIKRNDAGLVEMFLGKGADPNRRTASGLHPLFAALDCSSAQTVRALVKHGADVSLRDRGGLTVLQAAFDSPLAHDKSSITGVFEALLSGGADAKVRYPDGTTLLHHAVRPGLSLERVAQQLLQHDVDVTERDSLGNTALHVATHSRPCVEMLLKHGGEANRVNNAGLTPLLLATSSASKKDEPDLEPLIKVSNVRRVDRSGKTALHLAAENGLEKTVRLLLQARAETTLVDAQKRTPLILAVINHRWSIVPLLAIQPGINSWDESGMTALHHIALSTPRSSATWKDIASATVPFCGKGVSRSMRDRSGATPLIQAMKTLPEEGLPVVEVLLSQKGLERNNCVGHEDHKQRSALYFAGTLGKPSFVHALLKHGAPFDLREWKPKRGPIQPTNAVNKQILKIFAEQEWLRRATLLQRQSGIAADTHILPKIFPIRDLNELLSMGLDPNGLPKIKFTSPMLWVILNQTVLPPPLPPQFLNEILKLILSFGANPNATTSRASGRSSPQGRTSQQPLSLHPLTFILEQFPAVDIDLVTLFLDNGANLSTPSPFYDSRYPLHSAVQANRMDLVDEFLVRRADANCTDSKGRMPLFTAAEKGFWELADLLLRYGGKVDVRDSEGNTPLHAAALGGNKRIVAALLRAGAKASVKNAKGATPLAIVPDTLPEKEKEKLIQLLKYTEEQEKRDAERKQKLVEREAVLEGKGRLRKEREEIQRQKTPTQKEASLPPPPPPPPSKPSEPSKASKAITPPPVNLPKAPTNPEPVKPSRMRLAKQLVKIRYTAPSSKPQQSTTTLAPLPATEKPPPAAEKPLPVNERSLTQPTKPLPPAQKPLPQPRVDSGFVVHQMTKKDEKPLPVLNREQSTFDSGAGGDKKKKHESQDELASWLAMSKMLDRL